jgi:hypothetical protein
VQLLRHTFANQTFSRSAAAADSFSFTAAAAAAAYDQSKHNNTAINGLYYCAS